MNNYNLFFENDYGQRRVIATFESEDVNAIRVARGYIQSFCTDHKFKIPYIRMWNADGETVFDVGSHTEFFYLNPKGTLNL